MGFPGGYGGVLLTKTPRCSCSAPDGGAPTATPPAIIDRSIPSSGTTWPVSLVRSTPGNSSTVLWVMDNLVSITQKSTEGVRSNKEPPDLCLRTMAVRWCPIPGRVISSNVGGTLRCRLPQSQLRQRTIRIHSLASPAQTRWPFPPLGPFSVGGRGYGGIKMDPQESGTRGGYPALQI
ncbi:jg21380 [Pararge aegeria aegeria]|uniref:Jg21380 protein n=1 Tax=Pararge aegeria aegeria TaxID=348720 RepID=A0A8S4S141_9NEOP|nr:jg21380 [Pararge aegeria aegeria]